MILLLLGFCYLIISNTPNTIETVKSSKSNINQKLAIDVLKQLDVKGRAPKTGYSREQFGSDWAIVKGCNMRNIILNRDMTEVTIGNNCVVTSGVLNDPYSGEIIKFSRNNSDVVQIDHVVALSDAWQKGAQKLALADRIRFANDPLELLAVDGAVNIKKGDGDAATWLPPNKTFRCQYVARQIAIKSKYKLWVTAAEHDAILRVLDKCPQTMLPSP